MEEKNKEFLEKAIENSKELVNQISNKDSLKLILLKYKNDGIESYQSKNANLISYNEVMYGEIMKKLNSLGEDISGFPKSIESIFKK